MVIDKPHPVCVGCFHEPGLFIKGVALYQRGSIIVQIFAGGANNYSVFYIFQYIKLLDFSLNFPLVIQFNGIVYVGIVHPIVD